MYWLRSVSLAFLLSIFTCLVAFAQGTAPRIEVQVHVSYGNDRPVSQQLQIDLLNAQGTPVGQTFSDSTGQAVFYISGGGIFRARASGADIEDVVSDAVSIAPQDRLAYIWVRVRPKAGATSANASNAGAAVTTANELRIPADAKKSFMKGMEALYRHDYQQAVEQFEKAITTYPQYDSAYDNLAVTYMQLGQTGKARAAFERAVQLNDKNADADRNYARLLITNQDYARAEELLNKALVIEPQDPTSLTLISIAQLRTGDVEGALENALKVHQVPHQGLAIAHYVAGRAYEQKQQYQKATAEYETYLRESPDGPEVQQVRNALARVTANASAAPQPSTTPQ